MNLTPGKYGNVYVVKEESNIKVTLHGNEIVFFHVPRGIVILDHCGFKTKSTARNINKFMKLIDDHRYVQIRSGELILVDNKRNISRVMNDKIPISLSGRQMYQLLQNYLL